MCELRQVCFAPKRLIDLECCLLHPWVSASNSHNDFARFIRPHRRRPTATVTRRVQSVGVGVASSILPIFMLTRASARSAFCAPSPGVLVFVPPVIRNLMWRAVVPVSLHLARTSALLTLLHAERIRACQCSPSYHPSLAQSSRDLKRWSRAHGSPRD